jgi:hypothetical protein
MRRKIFVAIVLGGCVLVTSFVFGVRLGIFTPIAPAGWSQIHTGMSREQVLQLIGTPQQSGWPEDIAETWEIRGAICSRRLFINYKSEERGVGQVEELCEGTWLTGLGWMHPRIERQ